MSFTAMPQSTRPSASPEARLARDPEATSIFQRWPGYFALTIAGVAGFVGLLMAGHYLPQWGQGFRIAALIWFAWFGVLRLATAKPH